eukprot:21349-Heterococcus_DN1.PRE.2
MTSALCTSTVASAAAVELFKGYRVSAGLALDLVISVQCVVSRQNPRVNNGCFDCAGSIQSSSVLRGVNTP